MSNNFLLSLLQHLESQDRTMQSLKPRGPSEGRKRRYSQQDADSPLFSRLCGDDTVMHVQ